MRKSSLYILILFAIIAIPAVHAATNTGWYYAGDTFKINDVLYSVEGNDYTKVMLGVGSNLYMINLDECKVVGFSKYCYEKSAYPSDKSHIKYAAGHEYIGYYISIQENLPTIKLTRTISKNSIKFNEVATVEVTIENSGDYPVNSFNYTETIPEGFELNGGGKSYSFYKKTFSMGQLEKFSYDIRATGYNFTSIQPNVSYVYLDKKFNITVSPLSLSVDTPLVITRTVNNTLNIGDIGSYRLNITNKDKDSDMVGAVKITVPDSLYLLDVQGITKSSNGYVADINLKTDESEIISFRYGTSSNGDYRIGTNVSVRVGEVDFTRYSEDSINANSDKLVPTIKLSSTRTTFKPGEQIRLSAILGNTNKKTTFTSISGTLSAPGLFEDKSFSHEAFPPGKNITEAEDTITIPQVDSAVTKTITLKGKYLSPSNEFITFEQKKDIKIEPVKEYIRLIRTITPSNVTPGSNITVSVSAKNIYNEYVSFSASESYDSAFKRIGGITFADVSLNRDELKELYTYQLQVLDDSSGSHNITTSAMFSGEQYPMKYSQQIDLGDAPKKTALQQNSTNSTASQSGKDNAAVQGQENAPVNRENLSFFGKIWFDIKKWFNS